MNGDYCSSSLVPTLVVKMVKIKIIGPADFFTPLFHFISNLAPEMRPGSLSPAQLPGAPHLRPSTPIAQTAGCGWQRCWRQFQPHSLWQSAHRRASTQIARLGLRGCLFASDSLASHHIFSSSWRPGIVLPANAIKQTSCYVVVVSF